MNKLSILCICSFFFSLTVYAAPDNKQTWSAWVSDLRTEALAEGIQANIFDEAFSTLHAPSPKVMSLDKHQPEHRLTYIQYRNSRGDAFRISMGVKKFKQNQDLMEKIGQSYGVDPCIVTSLWGMETSYGSYMGNFPTIQALATLAYDNRRSAHFREELLLGLRMLNDGSVSLANFKGEWAGATGQPQFLPSSYYKYAVDYDGDGHKNIWTSVPDVLASIANFMAKNGWQANQPWSIEVKVPDNIDPALVSLKMTKTLAEWAQLGVLPTQTQNTLSSDTPASLIMPDGGPNYLVFKNFRVLMRYNNSTFYAGTIGYVAQQICKRAKQKTTDK